jgi:4a-hydroxytetrahydrobiopterin dehydratase
MGKLEGQPKPITILGDSVRHAVKMSHDDHGDDMAQLLSEDDIASRLENSQWRREGDEIVRESRFADFAEAMAFVNRVAEAAEQANHHPDILVHGWNKVRLSLTNHAAGGLTDADFEMAKRIDTLG